MGSPTTLLPYIILTLPSAEAEGLVGMSEEGLGEWIARDNGLRLGCIRVAS